MSEEQFTVSRGGSGHEWYVCSDNGKRISCSEYEHEARFIADKLNAYPKLVFLTKGFRDACKQNPTNNNETVAELIKTLLTELNETGD